MREYAPGVLVFGGGSVLVVALVAGLWALAVAAGLAALAGVALIIAERRER